MDITESREQRSLTQIDTYLQLRRRELRLPGCAVGIVQDNQVVYLHGFGKADPTGRPVTPQTPFVLGSLSKILHGTRDHAVGRDG